MLNERFKGVQNEPQSIIHSVCFIGFQEHFVSLDICPKTLQSIETLAVIDKEILSIS